MAKDDISKELEAIEDEQSDDYFEEVLKTELQLPTDDDDAGADASDKKVVDDDSKETKDEDDPTKQLEVANARVAELEKEAKGRLSDTVKSRQEKAAMKAELNELTEAVSSLLEKRDDALKKEQDDKPVPLEDTKQGIEFDDDDKAFVDLTDVKAKIEAETKPVKDELEALKAERESEKQKSTFKETVDGIISENEEAFKPAMGVLQDAYKDLNEAVITLQTRLGIMDEDGTIDQDKAIDLLDGSPELEAFAEKHPGIDPIQVARAFNSKVDFRTSLRGIAEVKKFGVKDDSLEDKLDEKIKKAKDKPGSLAGSESQAVGNADLIARITDMSYDQIESFSDAEVAKIEAMLEQEALKGE